MFPRSRLTLCRRCCLVGSGGLVEVMGGVLGKSTHCDPCDVYGEKGILVPLMGRS